MPHEGLRMGDGLCLVGEGASPPIYFVPSLISTSSAVHLPWADSVLHEPFLSFYGYHFCKSLPPGNPSWVLCVIRGTSLAFGTSSWFSSAVIHVDFL